MNMDNLLSIVLNNLTAGVKVEPTLSGQLNLLDFMPQGMNLKTGETLLLNLTENGSMLVTDTKGQQALVQESALTLDRNIEWREPVVIEAKLGKIQNDSIRVQVLHINDQEPSVYLRGQTSVTQNNNNNPIQSLIIKDISNPQTIPLQNVKLGESAAVYINELPISKEQKGLLQEATQQVELKVQINKMSPDISLSEKTSELPILQKISTVLNDVSSKMPILQQEELVQPSQQSQQIAQTTVETIAQTLKTELEPLVGTTIETVVEGNNFVSDLGPIYTEIPLQIPEEMKAELEIIEIITTRQTVKEPPLSASDKLFRTIEILKEKSPELYQQITNKLPTDNEKMLSNMTAFTKAAVSGDIHQWLGKEIVQQLEFQGETGKAILSDLQNAVQSSSRQSPVWRMIEIPYYFENRMEKIKLAIKQYPDDENEQENPRKKFGTRFIVDTNFSKLGAFQFDGFSFAKDRRFDLIIRTEKYIGDDLCANIMRLFKSTLNDVQYTGNIKVNLKENFIKISENNDDKFLTQGLFV